MSYQAKLVAAFATVYLVWGSTYLAIKFGIETFPPFLMMGVRFTIAGAILLAVAAHSGNWRLDKRQAVGVVILSLTMVVFGTGIVAWVEGYLPSGLVSLILAISPVWLVFLDSLLPEGRVPGPKGLVGVFIGLAGLLLLISPESMGGQISWLPLIALLVSAFSWSTGSIYGRHAKLNLPPMVATAWQMLLGGVLLILISLALGEAKLVTAAAFTPKALGAIAYLIVFGSILVFPAYTWLMQNVRPALVGTHAYVNPIVALGLGWMFADEPITGRTIIATVVIISAVCLIGADRGRGATVKGPSTWFSRLRRMAPPSADICASAT